MRAFLAATRSLVDPSAPRLVARWAGFRRQTGGAVAINFALVLVPLLGAVGGAVDFTYAYRVKAKLDAAADAGALSAISGSAMTRTAAEAKASGLAAFGAEIGPIPHVTVSAADLSVTDNGLSRTATLNYTSTYKTYFMQVLGINALTLVGSSTASVQKSPYIDFYVLLDNTPSMGVGATTADINKMVSSTKDQCAFACHDLSNKNDYYSLAKTLGVTMRIDVVRQATQALIDNAQQTSTDGQYRVAIYDYGTTANNIKLQKVAPLQSNLPNAKVQAADVDLMKVPDSSYNNDMDSPHESILTAMNAELPNPGDGTTAKSPQQVLFFVSDGVTDASMPKTCSKALSGTQRCQQPMAISQCTAIKQRGIKIAVLYTTYLPLPTNGWYNAWIKPFQGEIATNMQACASPGLFFEVSPSQGITEAMITLFNKATLAARLTQ